MTSIAKSFILEIMVKTKQNISLWVYENRKLNVNLRENFDKNKGNYQILFVQGYKTHYIYYYIYFIGHIQCMSLTVWVGKIVLRCDMML